MRGERKMNGTMLVMVAARTSRRFPPCPSSYQGPQITCPRKACDAAKERTGKECNDHFCIVCGVWISGEDCRLAARHMLDLQKSQLYLSTSPGKKTVKWRWLGKTETLRQLPSVGLHMKFGVGIEGNKPKQSYVCSFKKKLIPQLVEHNPKLSQGKFIS